MLTPEKKAVLDAIGDKREHAEELARLLLLMRSIEQQHPELMRRCTAVEAFEYRLRRALASEIAAVASPENACALQAFLIAKLRRRGCRTEEDQVRLCLAETRLSMLTVLRRVDRQQRKLERMDDRDFNAGRNAG